VQSDGGVVAGPEDTLAGHLPVAVVIRHSFPLPLEGGARLNLSNVMSRTRAWVSRIDNLLGRTCDTMIIMSSR